MLKIATWKFQHGQKFEVGIFFQKAQILKLSKFREGQNLIDPTVWNNWNFEMAQKITETKL